MIEKIKEKMGDPNLLLPYAGVSVCVILILSSIKEVEMIIKLTRVPVYYTAIFLFASAAFAFLWMAHMCFGEIRSRESAFKDIVLLLGLSSFIAMILGVSAFFVSRG